MSACVSVCDRQGFLSVYLFVWLCVCAHMYVVSVYGDQRLHGMSSIVLPVLHFVLFLYVHEYMVTCVPK